MTPRFLKPAVFASVILLAACSSTPTTTSQLDQARADFIAASNNPQVPSYAPLEFKQASDALNAANVAAAKKDSLEDIDRLAYIAKQKIATAQEVARGKAAEANIADASRQRTEIALEARTAEAERAKRQAADAQAAAALAQQQAANAQQQAAVAQDQTRAMAERAAKLEALLVEHEREANRARHGHHHRRRAVRHQRSEPDAERNVDPAQAGRRDGAEPGAHRAGRRVYRQYRQLELQPGIVAAPRECSGHRRWAAWACRVTASP